MCFDVDSSPPIPVLSGGALTHEELVLHSDTDFAAFAALPDDEATTGVVILPDVRGLFRFYEELALRFAERGCAAIAIDYFGRTADVAKRDDDFEYMPHVEQTTEAGVQADVRAAVEWLRGRGVRSVFSVGFCFGGRNSWIAAASGDGPAGGVGFCGRRDRSGVVAASADGPAGALQAGAGPGRAIELASSIE